MPEKPNMVSIDHNKPRFNPLGLKNPPKTPEELIKGTNLDYSKEAISQRAMPSYLLDQLQKQGGFSTNPEVRDKVNATIRMQQEKDSAVMAGPNWSKDDLKNLKSERLQDLKKVDEKNNLIGTGQNDTREQSIFFNAVKNQSNRTSSLSQDTDRQGKKPEQIIPTTSFNTFPLNLITGIPTARFANSVKPETTLKGLSKSVKDIFNSFSNPKNQNSLMPAPSVDTEDKTPSPAPTPTQNNTSSIADIPAPPAIGQENIKEQTKLTQVKPQIITPTQMGKAFSMLPSVVRGTAAAGLGILALTQALRGPVVKPPPVIPKPVPVPPVPNPVPPDPTKPDPTKVDPEENPEDEIRRRKKEKAEPKPVDPKPEEPDPEKQYRIEPKPKPADPVPPDKKEEPPKKEEDKKIPEPWQVPFMLPTQSSVQSFPSLITGIPTHSAPSFEKTQLEINYYSELGF